MAPGIKILDFDTDFESLVGPHWLYEEFLDCIHLHVNLVRVNGVCNFTDH